MNNNTTRNWVISALYGADDPERMTEQQAADLVAEWKKEGSITDEDIPHDYTPFKFAVIWNEMLRTFRGSGYSFPATDEKHDPKPYTFKLHTFDIQRVLIALALRDKSCDTIADTHAYGDLEKLFTKLNQMTDPNHGYALTVTVEA